MRKAVRAIILDKNKLLVMHRNKFGKDYYTLVGGGVDFGENADQALVREVKEETGLVINKFRTVFVEEPGDPYGDQYIYLCEFPGGEPRLPSNAIESQISELGKNLYKIGWLTIDQLKQSDFLSENLKRAIIHCYHHGFPDRPIKLDKESFNEEANNGA